jgi:hypothetical protein
MKNSTCNERTWQCATGGSQEDPIRCRESRARDLATQDRHFVAERDDHLQRVEVAGAKPKHNQLEHR